MQIIINEVCNHFHQDRADILGDCRKREFVEPRHFCCFFGREFTTLSLNSIGMNLGGRDHASILHGIRTTRDLIDVNGYRSISRVIRKAIERQIVGTPLMCRLRRIRYHYRSMAFRSRKVRAMCNLELI